MPSQGRAEHAHLPTSPPLLVGAPLPVDFRFPDEIDPLGVKIGWKSTSRLKTFAAPVNITKPAMTYTLNNKSAYDWKIVCQRGKSVVSENRLNFPDVHIEIPIALRAIL